jgi:hypothetical protein
MNNQNLNNIPLHMALVKVERTKEKGLPSGVPREIIVESLDRNLGNANKVSKELSIPYVMLSNYIEKDTELRSLCIKHRESILDDAEQELRDAINNGDGHMVRFALKTLGRDRGYVERSEKDVHITKTEDNATVNLNKLSVDDLKSLEAIAQRNRDTQ